VLALSAYVKKDGLAETKLIDFNIVLNQLEGFEYGTFQEFFHSHLSLPKWRAYEPNIVGISALFTPSYQNVLDIAQCCRQIFPKAVIVAGGAVPTNMYKQIFEESSSFDALCFGEGEIPLTALIQAPEKTKYLETASSWITPSKAVRGETFQLSFIQDLDEIPFYDYSVCNLEDYRLNPTISAYPCVDDKKKYITIMVSRGCPHRCCYCSAHTVHGRTMRYYSLERVRQDLTYVKEKFGVETIIFQDDHFLAKRQRAFDILALLKELELTPFFPNSLALYALDREMLEAFKSAGLKQLVMAIESGSEKVLRKIMHKPLNLDIVRRVAADCRDLGIFTDASIIIGFPGETKKDIDDARAFLKTIDVNWFRIYAASPLVGSELFEICRKGNYIKGDYTKCNFKKSVIETEDFTVEYIQETAYEMNLELNFVGNSDFRLGEYRTALQGFENAIKAKSDHALAYYYGGLCYEKLGEREKAQRYLSAAKTIVREKPFWRKYAEKFNVPI